MQSINLDQILRNESEFTDISYTIENRYRCDWNDEVHDSFWVYVQEQKKASENIHNIREKAYKIQEEAESLEIESMLSEIDRICMEAMGL